MIVHIGYHKTGTTYLQNKIFPNLENLIFIPYFSDNNLLGDIARCSTLDIDFERIKTEVESLGEEKTILYSNEGLIGPLFYSTGVNKMEIANNLKEVGTEKIIITIRNQISLLESIYKQYIQEGGVAKFDFFINKWQYSFNLNHINFYPLINYYSKIFGKENVLIILNEELRNNEKETIKKIEEFTNSRYKEFENKLNPKQVNKSLSNKSLSLLRIVNHFLRSNHRPSNLILPNKLTSWKFRFILQRYIDPYILSKIFKNKSLINSKLNQELSNYYKNHNIQLQNEFDINLEKYNYPL